MMYIYIYILLFCTHKELITRNTANICLILMYYLTCIYIPDVTVIF